MEKEGILQTWGLAKALLVWSCVSGLTETRDKRFVLDKMGVGWQCLCVLWLLLTFV